MPNSRAMRRMVGDAAGSGPEASSSGPESSPAASSSGGGWTAARAAGVSQLAYTSLFNAAESELIVAQPHRGTEPVIRESGIPYTLLRNNLYSEHFAPFVRQALQSGSFASSTRDGRVASASLRMYS